MFKANIMKLLLLIISVLILNLRLLAQNYQVVHAENAYKYKGKEITVEGKLCSYGNSSYGQFAWFYLGPDTAHRQLKVIVQGNIYLNGNKISISNYIGKIVLIKGIVKDDKEIYLNATDTLMLKH